MKKSAVYSVISAVSACVFLFSSVMSYAAWRVQDDTINKVTMASVRGQIVEEYEQDTVVYPGGTVNKYVQVQNTGTIDALPRVRIEKAWGDSRDADGNLIVNPDLSTDNILITYNTEDWIYKEDGYFYYGEVLKPGEMTVSLFDSFSIDEHSGGEYKNKYADIVVSMEIIQVEGDALSFWDTSFEDLGITYRQTDWQDTVTTVVFHDNKKGFTFDVNEGDLFANFKDLIPGESRSQRVTVTNKWDNPVEIFFWADFVDQEMSEGRTGELVIELLHEHANIVITEDNGAVIYDGPIWGSPDVESYGTDSMKFPYSLGSFASGQTKNINVSLYLDPKMDNELLDLLGLIKWVFSAQGDESTVVETTTSSDVGSSETTKETAVTTDESVSTGNSSIETSTTAESVSTGNSSLGTETATTAPNGSTTRPTATTAPNGSTTTRPTATTAPNGNTTTRPTATTAPNGNTTTRPTATTAPNGSTTRPTATTAPNLNTTTRPTATTAPNGSTTRPTATTAPNGSATTKPTATTVPNGGTTTRPTATTVPNGGTTTNPTATTVPNGSTTTRPTATTAPNGSTTTDVSTSITTKSSSTNGSESTTETLTTTTDTSSDGTGTETNSGTTKDASDTSSTAATTSSSSTTTTSSSSSMTSTDYPSSPKTSDSFKIGLYAILAITSLITMPIMYRKAKDESEQ